MLVYLFILRFDLIDKNIIMNVKWKLLFLVLILYYLFYIGFFNLLKIIINYY